MTRPIITLTTDFGASDAYVAAMKGVILNLCAGATIVDVSHSISRHDVEAAAYVLDSASTHYPAHAVHVAIVDPGVGSSRRPLILQTPRGIYVSPDNGATTHILNEFGAHTIETEYDGEPFLVNIPESCQAYELDKPGYWLPRVSRTFHGRDIFAPTAAHLANGTLASELGSPIESVVCLPIPRFLSTQDATTGTVVHIDTYGNLITNIPEEVVPNDSEIKISGRVILGLSESYQESLGELLAIIGSRNTLEIAVGQGDARTYLNASIGDQVFVQRSGTNPITYPG